MAKKRNGQDKEKEAETQLSFEQSLERLEQVVQELEEGGLGLGESLARYEQGVTHLKNCYHMLQRAERKIQLLTGSDAEGQPVTEPFDEEDLTLEQKSQSRSRRRSRPKKADTTSSSDASGTAEADIDPSDRLF